MPKAITLSIFRFVKKELIAKLNPYCEKIEIPNIQKYTRSMRINVKPKKELIDGIFGEEMILSQDFFNTIYKYGNIVYDTSKRIDLIKFPEDILLKFKIEV